MKNNIEYRNLKDLKLLENNPRKISKESMEQLIKSITDNPDYFEARPIILSDRTGELVIIAGNQRYKAAKKIGLKQVPTFLLSGLTEEKEREIVIRDNARIEQYVLEQNKQVYAFHKEWMEEVYRKYSSSKNIS